jgi:hypothetical protein
VDFYQISCKGIKKLSSSRVCKYYVRESHYIGQGEGGRERGLNSITINDDRGNIITTITQWSTSFEMKVFRSVREGAERMAARGKLALKRS